MRSRHSKLSDTKSLFVCLFVCLWRWWWWWWWWFATLCGRWHDIQQILTHFMWAWTNQNPKRNDSHRSLASVSGAKINRRLLCPGIRSCQPSQRRTAINAAIANLCAAVCDGRLLCLGAVWQPCYVMLLHQQGSQPHPTVLYQLKKELQAFLVANLGAGPNGPQQLSDLVVGLRGPLWSLLWPLAVSKTPGSSSNSEPWQGMAVRWWFAYHTFLTNLGRVGSATKPTYKVGPKTVTNGVIYDITLISRVLHVLSPG